MGLHLRQIGTRTARSFPYRPFLQAVSPSEHYLHMINLQMQTLHLQNQWRTCNFCSGDLPAFSKGSAKDRLTEAFPYLITRVGVSMEELFARRLESYGATLPMYRVMAALWQRGGQRLGDLSEMTSVEISTLSRLVG